MFKNLLKKILIIGLIVACSYGIGRLYFYLTGGFTLNNISSNWTYQPDWEIRPLAQAEQQELQHALNQSYQYLGKGCQSYVFLSEDEQYVIKFFKYQRFRLSSWLAYFPPLPAIVQYRQEKLETKWKKLDGFVKSWKIAFEHLKEETGLVFVHLNKTQHLKKQLAITDKLGLSHLIDLDQMEFCIQRRAEMLCDTLLTYKVEGDLQKAQLIISRLIALILSEYERGLADNDHALMQNTGVVKEQPIHIDVGQFVLNESIKNPEVYRQELFTKMYKFKLWLKEQYPELAIFLDEQLKKTLGSDYAEMQPKFRQK